MDQIVRIGKISTIDYTRGTASVIYTDRNNEPSPNFPFFSFAYDMPKVDDTVVVLLLPNSTTKGFILGVPWSGTRIPEESGQGVFYKKFSDGAYVKYDAKTKQMDVAADRVVMGSVKADIVEVIGQLEAEAVITKTLSADNVNVKKSASMNNLNVSGLASIHNLDVSGTATGNFPMNGGMNE